MADNYNIINSKHVTVILKNIRDLREYKKIKVETMATAIGISKGEYSKLENNIKPTLDKYFNKIAAVLEIEPFDLAMENCLSTYINQGLPIAQRKNNQDFKEIENARIIKLLDERDLEKTERIAEYKEAIDNWKAKYYKMKALLNSLEQKYDELANMITKNSEIKSYN